MQRREVRMTGAGARTDAAGEAIMPLAELRARVGQEVGVSGWLAVDQSMIDAFAELTDDHQFIHVDPERARAETGFGGTIAHGFLTLALLPAMARTGRPAIAGVRMGLNYGFDRIRFLTPVPAGARLRGRFFLAALEERARGEVTLAWDVTVEIEGAERPALVARWLSRQYVDTEA